MLGYTIARRYRLLEVIGSGACCVVYRAADLHMLDEVAVKVLHDSHVRDPSFIARMDREYEILDLLRGTAAPAVYAFCREGNDVCLVMELLRGRDFASTLAEAKSRHELLPQETVIRCIEPVVATLEVAHQRGIVHRDLKPGNIFMLEGSGSSGVRLLDFGLGKFSGARKITGPRVVLGSPSYIAPEVWQGKARSVDHRADVYSVGAIIYRALTGRVPFPAETLRDKREAATKADRPSLHALRPDLPMTIDAWTRQALAIDPEERFANVRALWNALLDAIGVPEEASPRGMVARR